jgi:multiple sugar transport system ATP-binding protein
LAELELSGVSKVYGAFNALREVSLQIADGEFAVFVGPSGCGKSTLLRLIAGLDPVSDGRIAIGGNDMTARQAGQRPVAMVFQNYALYPHMSVFENIAFPLQMERRTKDDIRREVSRAAEIVQLSTRLQDRPAKLSGGQRQRVAIARAIVRKPGIFLMDEPLSNLDAALRMEMRAELTQLHRRLGSTMVYVTHDQLEAMTMADRIVVLNGGRVEQVGAPMELYHNPANLFVAGFIGSPPMNFAAARVDAVEGNAARLTVEGLGSFAVSFDGKEVSVGDAVTIGIRPEAMLPGAGGAGHLSFRMTPETVERLGLHTIVHAPVGAKTFTALFNGDPRMARGSTLDVSVPLSQIHLFDRNGAGRSIRDIQ